MELYNKRFAQRGICKLFGREKLNQKKALQLLSPQKEDRILEVGCNRGEFVNFLRNYSSDVVGCDINKDAIIDSGIDGLDIMSADDLSYDDAVFDKIVSLHVVEHLPNLEKSLKEMERVLVSGGICVLIYPFEIIRGSNNFFEAWKLYGSFSSSRKLHINKLNPRKIGKITGMQLMEKGFFWGPYPTYFTVFRKVK